LAEARRIFGGETSQGSRRAQEHPDHLLDRKRPSNRHDRWDSGWGETLPDEAVQHRRATVQGQEARQGLSRRAIFGAVPCQYDCCFLPRFETAWGGVNSCRSFLDPSSQSRSFAIGCKLNISSSAGVWKACVSP